MAVRRTPDEIVDIVNHCIELEKTGGDIIGYLWSQDYISPKATWFNFQREWLRRKPYEYTSGRPDERRQKKFMNTKQKQLTDEQRAECARLAIEGMDPKPYIAGLGFKVPSTVWYNVKQWYKRNDPKVYEKISERVGRKKPEPEQPAVLKVDGPLRIETPEAKKVEIVEIPEVPAIMNPIGFGPYQVTAIRHPQFGEFYFDQKFECIDWRTQEGEEVSLKPEYWRKFAEAIPEILGVLGVKI